MISCGSSAGSGRASTSGCSERRSNAASVPSSKVWTPWSTAYSAVSTSAIGSERLPRVSPSVATLTIHSAVPSTVVTSSASPSGFSAVSAARPIARPRGGTFSPSTVGGAASSVPASPPTSAHRSP